MSENTDNETPMGHADWLRAIAAWVPDHAERLQEAADEIEWLAEELVAAHGQIATIALREVKPMKEALGNIKAEAERPQGNAIHLKRVVALQCRDALKD